MLTPVHISRRKYTFIFTSPKLVFNRYLSLRPFFLVLLIISKRSLMLRCFQSCTYWQSHSILYTHLWVLRYPILKLLDNCFRIRLFFDFFLESVELSLGVRFKIWIKIVCENCRNSFLSEVLDSLCLIISKLMFVPSFKLIFLSHDFSLLYVVCSFTKLFIYSVSVSLKYLPWLKL